jgi:hypothetical protein
MPYWLVYLFSLASFAIIGSTLGGIYWVMRYVDFFGSIKNLRLKKLVWIMSGIAILFPIWGFVFGYLGSGIGLSPTNGAPGWLVSIGVGIAIFLFSLLTE